MSGGSINDVAGWLSLGALALLLGYAIASDLKSRRIPNWLCAGVVVLALPWWWSRGGDAYTVLLVQGGLAAVVFAIFTFMFARGWMGGGDVKLITALALWVEPIAFIKLVLFMSVFGGVLTLVTVAHHRRARKDGHPAIPYGVAIAFAAFAILGEPVVKHLAG